MSAELKAVVKQMFKALDDRNATALQAAFADDVTALDEVSRSWLVGAEELTGHIEKLMSSVSDIRSDVQDFRTTSWGDIGVVACRLEQDYAYNGMRNHISAPTTVVLRRDGGAWKIAHFHSAPLPE